MSPSEPRPGRQPFTYSPSLHLCPWQSNPENSVGVLSMAGRGVEVHVALTSDVGKILSLSHGIKIGEKANLMGSIQVAQLALKHRQNKNQRQRIIVFVGSPIENEEKDLVKLGKKLKKNSVAMDIINFGEEAENASKLEALLNAVNSDDNSHLVTVPSGPPHVGRSARKSWRRGGKQFSSGGQMPPFILPTTFHTIHSILTLTLQ